MKPQNRTITLVQVSRRLSIDIPRQHKLIALANNRWLLIGSLLLFALVLNREGDRMPSGNEFIYLLYFFKAWHPTFLVPDWTFEEPTAGHAVFGYALGWLTCLLPLTKAAWLGRVVCWVSTFIALFRLGRYYKIQPWAVWAGILLWMLQLQSPVTGEWMIGTFEAKVIAYPLLLLAIDAALLDRALLAGVLCGLAFSFHTAIGMWGGAALGVAVLLHNPIRKTIVFSAATIVFSLPGLITSLPLIMGQHSISAAEAKYLATIALPDCCDPIGFSHTWIALLLILPVFTWMHARWRKEDRQIHQLLVFECALLAFFVFGLVSRIIGRFDWIILYPMRVYAVFAMLLFFWQVMSIVTTFIQKRPAGAQASRWVIAFGVLIFLSMPSPILRLRDMVGSHVSRYLHPAEPSPESPRGEDGDFIQAAQWINANTPETDLVIAPPWWNDCYFYMQRPLIVNWHAPRYNSLTEWKERIESLVGDTSSLTYEDALGGNMNPAAWAYYASLSPQQIAEIQLKYGHPATAKWLVTTGQYPYRVAFRAKSYIVYELPMANTK